MSDLHKNFPDTYKTWHPAQPSVGQEREKGRATRMSFDGPPAASDAVGPHQNGRRPSGGHLGTAGQNCFPRE